MIDDYFKYVFDKNGDRILIGLTLAETIEFERLDSLRRCSGRDSATDNKDPDRALNQRWLYLFEKHEIARSAVIESQKATKH
jgi:hypothetical protein